MAACKTSSWCFRSPASKKSCACTAAVMRSRNTGMVGASRLLSRGPVRAWPFGAPATVGEDVSRSPCALSKSSSDSSLHFSSSARRKSSEATASRILRLSAPRCAASAGTGDWSRPCAASENGFSPAAAAATADSACRCMGLCGTRVARAWPARTTGDLELAPSSSKENEP